MKIYLITLIILTITITGCGSEEEEKNNTKAAVTDSTVGSIVEETVVTSDLIIDPDFNLISSINLDVVLPASPSTTVSYFISICTDFYEESGEVIINYDSCKLRTTLAPLEQSFTLSLSAAELVLLAQIWPIEDGAQPINIYWNITDSGNSWQIAI